MQSVICYLSVYVTSINAKVPRKIYSVHLNQLKLIILCDFTSLWMYYMRWNDVWNAVHWTTTTSQCACDDIINTNNVHIQTRTDTFLPLQCIKHHEYVEYLKYVSNVPNIYISLLACYFRCQLGFPSPLLFFCIIVFNFGLRVPLLIVWIITAHIYLSVLKICFYVGRYVIIPAATGASHFFFQVLQVSLLSEHLLIVQAC